MDQCVHKARYITAELLWANLATIKRVELADEFAEDQGHERQSSTGGDTSYESDGIQTPVVLVCVTKEPL